MVFQWLLMSSTCRATKTTRNLEKNVEKILFFPRKNWSFVDVLRNEKDVSFGLLKTIGKYCLSRGVAQRKDLKCSVSSGGSR